MTPEQTARIEELDRLLKSEKHAHNPGRALWEQERYRIISNSVGQQGNYVVYASARDQQKADGLQKAIREIDVELASLDGQPDQKGRVNILRGDRQRFTDDLAALAPQPDGATNERELMAALPLAEGQAPEGFDYTVPEKYNQPTKRVAIIGAVSAPEILMGLATLATLPGGDVSDTLNEAINSSAPEIVDPFAAGDDGGPADMKTEGDDLEALEISARVAPADQEPAVEPSHEAFEAQDGTVIEPAPSAKDDIPF